MQLARLPCAATGEADPSIQEFRCIARQLLGQDAGGSARVFSTAGAVGVGAERGTGVFKQVLDIDQAGRDVQRNVVGQTAFRFQPISVSYERVCAEIYAEVLYPNHILDLIDFALRTCVQQRILVRKCNMVIGELRSVRGRGAALGEYGDTGNT